MGYNKETEDLSRSRKGRLPLTRRKSRCIIYASGKRTAEVFARPQIPELNNYWGNFGNALNEVLDKGTDPTAAVATACAEMNKANNK
jgi:maltose-binding protein MalE